MSIAAERDMFVIDHRAVVRWASTGAPLVVGESVADKVVDPEVMTEAVDRLAAGAEFVEFSTRLLPKDVLIRARIEPISGASPSLVHLRLWQPGGVLPSDFTERQLSIIRGVAHGLSQREIGERLGICRGTVESAVARARQQLGVRASALVVQWAVRHGLTDGNTAPLPEPGETAKQTDDTEALAWM